MTARTDPDALDTLALVLVARGDVGRAHALAVEALALRVETEPTSMDWMVIAKTAQALNLTDEAQAAYRRAAELSQRGSLVEAAALKFAGQNLSPRQTGTVRASL
jgi:Tfp pilus assembly protein PilF